MNNNLTETDRKIWEEELVDFLPAKIIDVHTHLWNERFAGENKDAGSMLRMNACLKDLQDFSRMTFPAAKFIYFEIFQYQMDTCSLCTIL